MEEKYRKAAQEILNCVGGESNIVSAAHCATRLRLVLKDDSKIDLNALEQIDLVKGNFNNGGQFQIILGTGIVNKVYGEFIQIAHITEMTKEELKQQAAKKMNPIQKLLKTLADVFVPILPALVASGLLMGINNILTAQGMFVPGKSLVEAFPAIKDIAEMVNLFSNAGFTFLPVLIGFSAAKIFGATPILGAVIGAIMIHPDLMNGYGYGQALLDGTVPYWNIFGFSVAKVGYQGTVLPVIASAFCLAVIEKRLRKVVPAMLDNIVTPLLSVLLAGALTFLFIGPVMRGVGDMMTNGVMWLFFDLGALGGLIYGVTYPLLVITGMHHSLNFRWFSHICSGRCCKLCTGRCRTGCYVPLKKRPENEKYGICIWNFFYVGNYRTSHLWRKLKITVSFLRSLDWRRHRSCLCYHHACFIRLSGTLRCNRRHLHPA